MRGRPARCRQVAGVDVTTGAGGAVRPSQTLTIATAAAFSLAVLLVVGGLSPTSGADAARQRTDLTPGFTMITSPDTWWTMDELQQQPRHLWRSAPRHLRRRHHRHSHQNRQPSISGLDLFRPNFSRPTTNNKAISGRRRFRHVDDKSTSGSDAATFKVIADPRLSDKNDPILLAAETTLTYFRFCDNRLISSAVDPIHCRSSSDDVKRRCLAELAELDNEAEVKFRQFGDVMALFDCRHAYSLASRCDECKVRNVHCK